MGKGVIGESAKDRAGNKMDKILERRSRKEDPQNKNPTLVEQFKAAYPQTWQEELDEFIKENENPEYLERKRLAKADFARAYYREIPPYQRNEITEGQYVHKKMKQWRREN